MSLYIKGATLPPSCWECDIGNSEYVSNTETGLELCPFYGFTRRVQDLYRDKRHHDCPILPVLDDKAAMIESILQCTPN